MKGKKIASVVANPQIEPANPIHELLSYGLLRRLAPSREKLLDYRASNGEKRLGEDRGQTYRHPSHLEDLHQGRARRVGSWVLVDQPNLLEPVELRRESG